MSKRYEAAMHTAEHVLNGVMVAMFDCGRCFSARINPGKSKCDYHFDRALSEDEATEVQRRVNEQLARNLPVSDEMTSVQDAASRYDLGRLPEGVNEVRVVHVGDFDSCPCIGQHVSKTEDVGVFRLTTHDYSEGVLRIRFKLD
ncbi:hypothetical protein [Desulfovibrio oxyclinae]|uniref:hypothetical protein n=1 Tax=Desulfovibrio oxyclinae TaxID=63560 RepID=UPI0003A75E3C|nr:hypothetical protein [Desulfovibrio oxyclinae]